MAVAANEAMRKVKDHHLSELLLQMRFTPLEKRIKQLHAAHELFYIIDNNAEYSFEFVLFKITEYNPKDFPQMIPLKGSDLAADLLNFIVQLSGQLNLLAADQPEEVYSIRQLAGHFNISVKTVERWRSRGLVTMRFVFEDGKKRLGFLRSSVERFKELNPGLTQAAGRFTQLDKKQKDQIIERACQLAPGSKSRFEAIARIAFETSRARETIRQIILNYENEKKMIFKKPSGVIDPSMSADIHKLYRQGCQIEQIAEHFNRARSSIYRIINARRARAVILKKIDYIPSDEFGRLGERENILLDIPVKYQIVHSTAQLSNSSINRYLQVVQNIPELKRDEEVGLFRKYNFLKYLASIARKDMKPTDFSGKVLKQIEGWLSDAENIKNAIIEANLRLVIKIARRHSVPNANLQDLISEGNFSLMSSIEKFDYTKGFRFATYASLVIAKGYARRTSVKSGQIDKSQTDAIDDMEYNLRTVSPTDILAVERARKSLINVIEGNLDEREQYIVLHHFGLTGSHIRKNKKTLQQIGDKLGITKERVRQLELLALQKLRQILSIEEFELLTR